MNIKDWHIPFRTHLELRSFKTRVYDWWFGDSSIGTFTEIVRKVSQETSISEEDAAKDVERILKRNTSQSILKPRHIEIAKELLSNGFGSGQIAEILSHIEGFSISKYVVLENPDLEMLRQRTIIENPQVRAHRGKSFEVEGAEIRLYDTDDKGVIYEYGKMPIQRGSLEYLKKEKNSLNVDQRERLAGALYTVGLGQKQIASVLTEITKTSYPPYTIGYILQKLKRSRDNPLEGYKPGTLLRAENRQLLARIEGNTVIIFADNEMKESIEDQKMVAVVDIPNVKITWKRDPAKTKNVDPTIIDRTIARLYVSGIAPIQIPDVILEAYEKKLTSKQVRKAIEREEGRGNLHKYAKGFFHKAGARKTKYQVKNGRILIWDDNKIRSQICIADGNIISQLDGEKLVHETSNVNNQENSARDKHFETYVRFRWHCDVRVGIAEELGRELGISGKEVKQIVSKQNAWGILKPAHVFIIRELANAGATPTEITRTLQKLEYISLSQSPIRNKLDHLKKAGFLVNQMRDLNISTEVVGDLIKVRDGGTGKIIKEINLTDVESAVRAGMDALYAYPPPTLQQYENTSKLARETRDSFEQIRQAVGLQADTLEALLLYGTYAGKRPVYETRFQITLDSATIDKLVMLAQTTDLTLIEIATRCNCNVGRASKYILNEAYGGDKDRYNDRFNPPPLMPEQEAMANRLAQENWEKDPSQRQSLTSIVNAVGGSFKAVRDAIQSGTYGNNEVAFASDYPAGRHDLPPQLVQDIIREVTTTNDSAYAISQRLGASDVAVSLVALVVVYDHDYERYAARFPEKQVDEAAVAAATAHIHDPSSPCRTYKAIAKQVSAEVAPISPSSVCILAHQLLTKPERAERFRGDPDYRIGQVTHVVAEGTCKRAATRIGIAAYSETKLRRPRRKQDGPGPTDQQRRWVKADLILRLKPGQATGLLRRAGAEGMPLMEEAGWFPQAVARAREILLEFSADTTPASVERKGRKYALGRGGRPKAGRLVLHVATADWWGEGRVVPGPDNLPNARVASPGFVADLLQMDQHDREVLAEMARNNRARNQAAQERLADQEDLHYCDDTRRYYADRGETVPDWRGPQETLDPSFEAAQKAAAATGTEAAATGAAAKDTRERSNEGGEGKQPRKKGLDPARLAEAREFARAIEAARDAGAENAGIKEKAREKKGIDPTRLGEAREYARAIEAARDAEKAHGDDGSDPNNFY